MRRNRGIIGKVSLASGGNANGIHDTHDQYMNKRTGGWSTTSNSVIITQNTSTIWENSSNNAVRFTVKFTGFNRGANVAFRLNRVVGNVDREDFVQSLLYFSGGTTTNTFSVPEGYIYNIDLSANNDGYLESNEIFTLSVASNTDLSNTTYATSANVTIISDPADTGSEPASGQQLFLANGTFTTPNNTYTISVVTVGGGGGASGSGSNRGGGAGGGGGLSYGTIATTPGETFMVVVGAAGVGTVAGVQGGNGGNSQFILASNNAILLNAGGGQGGRPVTTSQRGEYSTGGTSTGISRIGGGTGGIGGANYYNGSPGGGGGAAGYSGNGGAGTNGANATQSGGSGSGGGGAAGGTNSSTAYGGGGVGLLGEGSSGTGSTGTGAGGSGGAAGSDLTGGAYGGGGAAREDDTTSNGGNGGAGAVRVVWGSGRFYPSSVPDI